MVEMMVTNGEKFSQNLKIKYVVKANIKKISKINNLKVTSKEFTNL